MRKLKVVGVVVGWLLALGVAQGQDLKPFAGTWEMRLGTRNFLVLTLTPDGNGMSGRFEQPAKFETSNFVIFSNMSRDLLSERVVNSRLSDGVLHLTVANEKDAKDQDKYAMTLRGDHAELGFDGLPPGAVVPPYVLEHAPNDAKVSTDWVTNRAYVVGDSDVPSAEMKRIFTEDQNGRMGHVDGATIFKRDMVRREQTRALLAAGALHTGEDYREAAFIFQHGQTPQDYLLAHTLAMVAVSKGDVTSIWIAAASMDRYLQKIGQKQIFGTQFLPDLKGGWTQEPYDRGLISDTLRQQLGVPSQAEQDEELKAHPDKK
jgi:hypothetical protein